MHRPPKTKALSDILAALYPLPNAMSSEEDWLRSVHQDLDHMDPSELHREYQKARWCLLFDDRPDHWLVERVERLKCLVRLSGRHHG